MPTITVRESGVRKLLQDLNCHKAAGPDEIPTLFLHLAADELAPVITRLYQFSLGSTEVPQDWRDVDVVSIYKKGGTHIPANYRPVSLTSITCNILSTVKSCHTFTIILRDNQHGFRKRRSCETQLITTIYAIAK